MLIRSLELQRYGAFADRTIDFGTGRLSLVIGVNEAGKSTALDALSDLLWGIPTQSGQTHLYGRPALALAAALELPGGEQVHVLRRSTGLTRSDTGAEVAADWHSGTDSRARWRDSFGLSHAQLRAGGQQLCQGGGDLAELVFTARSGRAVRELLEGIEAGAGALYKEHRGNKSVAARQAYAEYEAAVQRVRDATAGSVQVQEAREVREQASVDVQGAEGRLRSARAAMAEADQRERAAPSARELVRVLAWMAELQTGGALLDDDQLGVHELQGKQLAAAEEALASHSDDIEELTGERSRITVDDDLLADAEAVKNLHLSAEARRADGKRAGELFDDAAVLHQQAATRIEELVGALGDHSLAQTLAELHVPVDRVAQLDQTAQELEDAEQDLRARAQALDSAVRQRAEADAGGEDFDADAVAAVREACTGIDAAGSAVSGQRVAIEAQADALRRRAEALRHAGLPTGAPVPEAVPSLSVVRACAEEWAGARTARGAAEQDLARCANACTGTEQQLADAEVAYLPEPGALVAARQQRDALLDEVIGAWRQGTPLSGAGDLPGQVEQAVAGTDVLADLLLTHADAAARRAELTKTLEAQHGERSAAAAALDTRTVQEHELAQCWASLWTKCGVATPTPADAEEVRRRIEEACSADEEAAAAAQHIAGLQPQVDQQTAALSAALARAGRPRPDADLDSLLTAARSLLDDDDATREHRAQAETLTRAEQRARRDHDRVAADQDSTQQRWSAGLRAAGVPEDLDVLGWRRRRDLLADAGPLQRQAAQLQEQAEEARTSNAEFLTAVGALSARHGVPDADPDRALTALAARRDQAVSDRRSGQELDRRLGELQEKVGTERRSRAEALAALEQLCAQAGLAGLAELTAAAARTRSVQELVDERERLTELIRAAAPDLGLPALIGPEPVAEPEVLQAACAAARQEVEVAEGDLNTAVARKADAGGRSRDLENRPGAADLHAQAQEHLAVVAERVERYLVARIQSDLLRGELEAYERAHSSPLLDEAGAILERLTEGRYVALGVTTHAGGRGLEIIGADAEPHAPHELSEGTADQVFLALRLAGIASLQQERQAAGVPSLPVVFDDVLMTFDDQRATAALDVLAEWSRQWQIIVFSHHEHLGPLAEKLTLEPLTVSYLAPPVAKEIHLSAAEVRLRARTMGPAPVGTAVGRAPQPAVTRSGTAAPVSGGGRSGAVREWARGAGYEIGDRGRIPADITAAYERAHA